MEHHDNTSQPNVVQAVKQHASRLIYQFRSAGKTVQIGLVAGGIAVLLISFTAVAYSGNIFPFARGDQNAPEIIEKERASTTLKNISPAKSAVQSPTPTVTKTSRLSITAPTITPSPTRDPNTPGSVEITVTDQNNVLLQNILLRILQNNTAVGEYRTDNKGYARIDSLHSGEYKAEAIYTGTANAQIMSQTFTIYSGENRKITIAMVIVTATPIPVDHTAPVIKKLGGPYDWGENGTCFLIQEVEKEANENLTSRWSLDDGPWETSAEGMATQCYKNISSGSHTVGAKLIDEAGNESDIVEVGF